MLSTFIVSTGRRSKIPSRSPRETRAGLHKSREKIVRWGRNKSEQMIRLDRSEGLDHRLGHPMFAVLFRQLVGATSVAYAALGRNDGQGVILMFIQSRLHAYAKYLPS